MDTYYYYVGDLVGAVRIKGRGTISPFLRTSSAALRVTANPR